MARQQELARQFEMYANEADLLFPNPQQSDPNFNKEIEARERTALTSTLVGPNARSQVPTKGLYIFVQDYGEGMANWRQSIAELFYVAKHLDATFVEPCARAGRLSSCSKLSESPGAKFRLHQVMDLTYWRSYHPNIITEEDFLLVQNVRQPEIFLDCQTFYGRSCGKRNTYAKKDLPILANAMNVSQTSTAIWQLKTYYRGGLTAYTTSHVGNSKSEIRDLLNNFTPTPNEYNRVKKWIHQVVTNSTTPPNDIDAPLPKFATIQWRPEHTAGLNHVTCAQAIIEARDVLSEEAGIPKENFLLMSSLSENLALSWGGVAGDAAASKGRDKQALAMLKEAGFKRLEKMYNANLHDATFPPVWDLITAELATSHSTCSGCNSHICKACNHQGSASKYFLEKRKKKRSTLPESEKGFTHNCWAE